MTPAAESVIAAQAAPPGPASGPSIAVASNREVAIPAGKKKTREDSLEVVARDLRVEHDRRQQLAESGDVDAIWSEMARRRRMPLDLAEHFALLLRAIEVRSRHHPREFAEETLARVVAMTSYLCLRDHFLVARGIEQFDGSHAGLGRVELPPALAERVIPRLLDLQRSLGEILHAQASVTRLHELARAKRLEVDRAGALRPGKGSRKSGAATGSKASRTPRAKARRTPGTASLGVEVKNPGGDGPTNRIAGVFQRLGPKSNGGSHGD